MENASEEPHQAGLCGMLLVRMEHGVGSERLTPAEGWEWPLCSALISILLLGLKSHNALLFLCIIESPGGTPERRRGLAIKGSGVVRSTGVTSKTLLKN